MKKFEKNLNIKHKKYPKKPRKIILIKKKRKKHHLPVRTVWPQQLVSMMCKKKVIRETNNLN